MNGINLSVKTHIVNWIGVLTAALLLAGQAAHSVSPHEVMLDIVDGDTSFLINPKSRKAWWIIEECRVEIPLEKDKKSIKTITSEIVSNEVSIGSHKITLRQQYRFTLDSHAASLEVYNSMRGGWSSISVQLNESCTLDQACRKRMERPEC